MQCRLFLDVVITESTAILKLFAGEDEALLVGRNTVVEINQYMQREGQEAPTLPCLGSWP